jgi:uncharacterized membrane protein YiaA
MSAPVTEGWGEFFICSGGATAALSGLIFVGLSVNLASVLRADRQAGDNFLTGRGLEALVALLNVTVISIVGLTPTISRGALAAFILLVAAESAISPARAVRAARRGHDRRHSTAMRILTAAALTVALLTCGVTLAAGSGGGLDWLPVAFVLAIFIAAVNGWILLVEVER